MRALMLALLVSTAFASQIHFSPAPLADLARRSQWVLVAERVAAATAATAPAPRYKVIETLRFVPDDPAAKVREVAPTGVVTVFEAGQDLRAAMAEHYAKHGNQGMPSPIVPRYASSLDDAQFAKAKQVILFVRRWKKDWQLAIDGGYEALAKKSEVLEALKP